MYRLHGTSLPDTAAFPAPTPETLSQMNARTALATPLLVAALALGAAPLAAQDQEAAPAATGDGALPPGVLATVNGRPVSALSLENIVRQIGTEGEAPDRERILGELIDLEILSQEAEKQSLDEKPEIAAALQLQYTQTMANAYLAATGDAMEVSEEDLRAEYERQTANLDREEYRASHILLETEEAAQAVIDELAGGADFAALAAERSIDPAGDTGGDLGWFQAGSMVPEFTAAVASMDVGETSDAPVKSDFGWHVIRLVDERESALPDYESVKPGLTNLVLRDRLARKVEELRAAADIKR